MGGTQGGCWKGLRAAAPGLPARQGEAITAASKVGSSIGPWPDRGSSLLRAAKAASGCEWPRIIEDLWGLSWSAQRMGMGCSPGRQPLASTSAPLAEQCAPAGRPGSRKLDGQDGPLQLCLGGGCLSQGQDASPRLALRERHSGYFPSGVTRAGVTVRQLALLPPPCHRTN